VCCKYFTLEDLMKRFDLPNLIMLHHKLKGSATTFRLATSQSVADIANEDKGWGELIEEMLKEVQSVCKEIGFTHAASKAFMLSTHLNKGAANLPAVVFAGHLESLQSDLEVCMFDHTFVQVEGKVRRYLKAEEMFGAEVIGAFPKAKQDIISAGESIAVDLNNAAVFHLMHVVEWGLRAFAASVGLKRVVADKKRGKTIPTDYAQWEKILGQVRDKVDAKIDKMKAGIRKQEAQQFYYPALLEIDGFKNAFRNHIMHTRADYTRDDAIAVWSHVERFMKNLAAHGLKELP
jgi:hypothetical protein